MRISKTTDRWFDVEDDPDKATIQIHHLTPGEERDILEECFKQDVKFKQKGKSKGVVPVVTQKNDVKLNRNLTLQKAVIGWTNFFDKKDKEMKCTPDNIKKASRMIDGFDILVNECRETLADNIKSEKEDQRKN